MSSPTGWPFSTPIPNTENLCVLLTTGAMNPIHQGHIQMLECAKTTLEQEGWSVWTGFISPSHDLYLQGKTKGRGFVSAEQRVKMAQLATKDSSWIEVATWESQQEGYWPDFPEVIDDLYQHVSQLHSNIFVFYVCGSDHVRYCIRILNKPRKGVVVVPRMGDNNTIRFSDPEIIYVDLQKHPMASVSSTEVRNLLLSTHEQSKQQLEQMLHPDVLQYISDHELYL